MFPFSCSNWTKVRRIRNQVGISSGTDTIDHFDDDATFFPFSDLACGVAINHGGAKLVYSATVYYVLRATLNVTKNVVPFTWFTRCRCFLSNITAETELGLPCQRDASYHISLSAEFVIIPFIINRPKTTKGFPQRLTKSKRLWHKITFRWNRLHKRVERFANCVFHNSEQRWDGVSISNRGFLLGNICYLLPGSMYTSLEE